MNNTRRAFMLQYGAGVTALTACSFASKSLMASESFALPESLDIPAADGAILRADLYRPAGAPPYPVLLVRTPYLKSDGLALPAGIMTLTQAQRLGFAVVIQDVRGTGVSDGIFEPLATERDDGAGTVAWLARQPWCNGRISTIGASYLGFTQFAEAISAATVLDGCVYVNTCGDAYRGWYYSRGGAFSVENSDRYAHFVATAAAARRKDAARKDEIATHAVKLSKRLTDGGAATAKFLSTDASWFENIVDHPLRDSYWQNLSYSDNFDKIRSPGLHIGGWFDFFSASTVGDFQRIRQVATPRARANQHLIMGPWTHISLTGAYAGHDFGPAASAEALRLDELVARFLKRPDGRMLPRATYFMMGANEWRESDAFPPRDMKESRFVLSAAADGASGLWARSSAEARGALRILFDPHDPVPTRGGRLLSVGDTWTDAGPTDQRAVEQRPDVVSVSTEPFVTPLEVVGPISLVLHVSTDMADADVAAVVTDVAPDGSSRLLCEGIGRLSLREGLDRRSPVEAGKIYQLAIALGVTANRFQVGHRLRVNLAGSNFPNYGLNLLASGGSINIHSDAGHRSEVHFNSNYV